MNKQKEQALSIALLIVLIVMATYAGMRDGNGLGSGEADGERMAAQSGGTEEEQRMALATAPIPVVPPPDVPLWVEGQQPSSFAMDSQCMQAGGNLRCNFQLHKMLNGGVITSPILQIETLTYEMSFTVRMGGTENVFSAPDDESAVVGIAFENTDVSMVGFVYDQEYDYWGIRKNDGYVKLCAAEGEVALSDWVCPWDEIVSE